MNMNRRSFVVLLPLLVLLFCADHVSTHRIIRVGKLCLEVFSIQGNWASLGGESLGFIMSHDTLGTGSETNVFDSFPSVSSLDLISGALFTEAERDSEVEFAFKYAVDRINRDHFLLPNTTLVTDIQYVPASDSFHASKKGKLKPIFLLPKQFNQRCHLRFHCDNPLWCMLHKFKISPIPFLLFPFLLILFLLFSPLSIPPLSYRFIISLL